MSFDPAIETPIRLQDVPKIKWLPGRRPGARLGVATVFRWAQNGLRGVKLEVVQIGGGEMHIGSRTEKILRSPRRSGRAHRYPARPTAEAN